MAQALLSGMYDTTARALGYRIQTELTPVECSNSSSTSNNTTVGSENHLHFCDVCREWVSDVSEHYQSVAHQFQRGCPPMRTTTLPVTNKGYQILTRSMGWDDYDGRGLGKRNQGSTVPIKFNFVTHSKDSFDILKKLFSSDVVALG